MLLQIGAASAEVIARRTVMMLSGTCSPAEYTRMVKEKQAAARSSARIMMARGPFASAASLLAPWHSRVTANTKRLRRS
jgi:hypothetical protein